MLNCYIGHFSVVDNVTDTHIYLNNPETGFIEKIEKIIFLRLWFDYDEHWYPEKNTDIQLRWMLMVTDK
jgi:predicted double-glycine peptidase